METKVLLMEMATPKWVSFGAESCERKMVPPIRAETGKRETEIIRRSSREPDAENPKNE
jgi:hypothetical protein